MAINTEKNTYTIAFAAVMVVIVGALLAFMASALSAKISENERLEKQQNILYAMGVNENEGAGSVSFIGTDKVAEAFNTYIKEQIILEGDKITKDPNAYLIDLKKKKPMQRQVKQESYLFLLVKKTIRSFTLSL